jgi:hypothetical protein
VGVRAIPAHFGPHAEKYDAGALGHWVGEKVAIGTNCVARSVAIQTQAQWAAVADALKIAEKIDV